MHAKLINAATNTAIELAKLAVSHHYDSPAHMAVDTAWKTVRESFVKQMGPAEQEGFRRDLEELYSNTKLHARTAKRLAR